MPTRHLPSARAVLATCLAATLSCASTRTVARPFLVAGSSTGFVERQAMPDGLSLLPPPPEKGSKAFALDEAEMKASLDIRGSRWSQAVVDADLSFPNAAGTFSCALGVPITEKDTPHLYALLYRTSKDASEGMSATKEHYRRARPFAMNGKPVCTPAAEQDLRRNGSYPSGHTAAGWVWALVLAEISPDRRTPSRVGGWRPGESRIVCNVHWYSDVVQGRTLASAVVARLHAETAFRDELRAAQAELVEVRARGLAPTRDCAQEASALQVTPLFPVAATHRP